MLHLCQIQAHHKLLIRLQVEMHQPKQTSKSPEDLQSIVAAVK